MDRDLCLGGDCGRFCLDACPYGVPRFGDEPDPKMQKCDFCLDEWQVGEKPACVTACPMMALDAGWLEDLEREYDTTTSIAGFSDPIGTRPAIRFRAEAGP